MLYGSAASLCEVNTQQRSISFNANFNNVINRIEIGNRHEFMYTVTNDNYLCHFCRESSYFNWKHNQTLIYDKSSN